MARNQEFYKGKRKKRSYALIPSLVLFGVIAIMVVLFYGMQQYAVITKDDVTVKLPILNENNTTVDSEGNIVVNFEKVDVSIVYDDPDYSDVKATAGKNVRPMRAIFVPAEDIYPEKLDEYAGRLNAGNALVLEMKPRSGTLMWESQSTVAYSYALSMPTEQTAQIPELIAKLKEKKDKKIYLVAQISCCLDELYASRSTMVTLRTEMGANYVDTFGTWLDAYNLNLRDYTVELVRELYDLGFDEVVLADVRHPTLDIGVNVTYTRNMSTTPSPINAVCGFALSVAEQLRDRPGKLSIYCDSAPALVRPDAATGQDAVLFMKLFDRVYYRTDKFAYPYNVTDIENNVEIGNVRDRLVPVVENYLPDNDSWVLVDVPEEE